MFGLIILLSIFAFIFFFALGYFVLGPLSEGFKPFTTPSQAARGERRRKAKGV